jgi:hypothetical protein
VQSRVLHELGFGDKLTVSAENLTTGKFIFADQVIIIKVYEILVAISALNFQLVLLI